MKKEIFTGAGTAIVTPMDQSGQVDFVALNKLLDFQLENGIDAIVVAGTTGEAATLTEAELLKVIDFVVQYVGHSVPVVAGTGSNDTRHSIFLSQKAEQLGVDGLLLVTPYYNKTSQEGLVQHYTAIADATDCPMIVYNVPSRTGLNIVPETLCRLSKHPNIVGVKEASGNISQIATAAALCKDELTIYSGNDDQIVPILSLGGKGVISVLSNIMPKQTHEICQCYLDGRVAEAKRLQLELMELINLLFVDVNPIPVKAALHYMGLCESKCRLPLVALSQPHATRLKTAMEKQGLL